jgi:hypothetical protein
VCRKASIGGDLETRTKPTRVSLDADVVGPAVQEFGRNQKIVWLESDANDEPVHRLAAEVLGHALFPDAGQHGEEALQREMAHVNAAMMLISEFFTACVYGYLQSCNADRRTLEARGERQPVET